jgi:hypothetical protein
MNTALDDYIWAKNTYGDRVDDARYQSFRIAEELCELIQAATHDHENPFTEQDMLRVFRYVASRPIGEAGTEIGDMSISLNIFATVLGYSVKQEREICLTDLSSRTPEQLIVKDDIKCEAGLI